MQEIEKESECLESRKARQRAKRNAKKNEKKVAKRKDLVWPARAPCSVSSSLHVKRHVSISCSEYDMFKIGNWVCQLSSRDLNGHKGDSQVRRTNDWHAAR